MIDDLDQAELLELIEGELDAQRAQALRNRVAQDPAALKLVNRLRADRAMLQSCRHPDLPRDFLAEIEPLVARPMLVGPQPGEFRRRHHRRNRRSAWPRIAAAAAVLLVCSAGLWATLSSVLDGPSEADRMASAGDDADPIATLDDRGTSRPGEDSRLASALTADPVTGTVHHRLPDLDSRPLPPGSSLARGDDESPAAGLMPEAKVRRLPAEFALVVLTDNQEKAENLLAGGLAEAGPVMALVRNFSIEEAEQLARQWRLARAVDGPDRRRSEPLTASVGDDDAEQVEIPRLERLARQAERQLRRMSELAEAEANVLPPSGQLSGTAESAPSLRQQLDFSSRGASLTITVPITDLTAMLEKLAMMDGLHTALQILPEEDGPEEAAGPAQSPTAGWPANAPQIRAALGRLTRPGEQVVVDLPVIIELTAGH